MFEKIRKFFSPRKIPCECGGSVEEFLTYTEVYYHCLKCKKDMDEEDFMTEYNLRKQG